MTTTIKIQNLKCGGCANTIKNRLAALDQISDIEVDTTRDEVRFNYEDPSQIATVTETLSKLGYPVDGESNSISKKAKSFVSCAVGRMNN